MIVAGYASTSTLDHALDVVMPNAFAASIRRKGIGGPRGIKFLSQHASASPVGKILTLEQRNAGLWMEAEIDESISYGLDLANAFRANGGLNFSVGYRLIMGGIELVEQGNDSFWRIHEADLHEVSVVTFPGNDECEATEARKKSIQEMMDDVSANVAKMRATPLQTSLQRASDNVAKMRQALEGNKS